LPAMLFYAALPFIFAVTMFRRRSGRS
jgi:hypothetical protein